MKWIIEFEHPVTGKKEYREYPIMAQWSNRKQMCIFLRNRKFLKEHLTTKIQQYDEREYNGFGDLFGELIFN